jgi:hypothetical protein
MPAVLSPSGLNDISIHFKLPYRQAAFKFRITSQASSIIPSNRSATVGIVSIMPATISDATGGNQRRVYHPARIIFATAELTGDDGIANTEPFGQPRFDLHIDAPSKRLGVIRMGKRWGDG